MGVKADKCRKAHGLPHGGMKLQRASGRMPDGGSGRQLCGSDPLGDSQCSDHDLGKLKILFCSQVFLRKEVEAPPRWDRFSMRCLPVLIQSPSIAGVDEFV